MVDILNGYSKNVVQTMSVDDYVSRMVASVRNSLPSPTVSRESDTSFLNFQTIDRIRQTIEVSTQAACHQLVQELPSGYQVRIEELRSSLEYNQALITGMRSWIGSAILYHTNPELRIENDQALCISLTKLEYKMLCKLNQFLADQLTNIQKELEKSRRT